MTDPILIRAARIVDGTGAPWFRADVLIEGGRIGAVGPDLAPGGARVLDAGDRYLAPGFIDAHCHDDLVALREPTRPEKVLQGVTTVVVGNCSFSLYPTRPASAEALRLHFSGLLGETAPHEVFDGLAAYRAALHRQGIGPNLVSLVGHAALRLAVMGDDQRPATPDECVAMADLLDFQLAEGAAGLSLGLVYPPSAYADAREMKALAATVRRRGRVLAAHVRSYEAGLPAAVDEYLDLLRASGAAGLLSHLQAAGRPNWGGVPLAIAKLEAARREGIDVAFDMYPYPAGSSYMLQLLPPEAQAGGLGRLAERLRDPVERAALRAWVETGPADPHAPQSKISLIGWANVLLSGIGAPALKRFEGMRMDAAAVAAGLEPFDLLARFVVEDAGQTAHRDVPARRGRPQMRLHASPAHVRLGRAAAPRHPAPPARLRHLSPRDRPARRRRRLVRPRGGRAPHDLGGGPALRPPRPRAAAPRPRRRPRALRRGHDRPCRLRRSRADAARDLGRVGGRRTRRRGRRRDGPPAGPGAGRRRDTPFRLRSPAMHVDDLETPVPVIDLDRVERNFRAMQDYCDRHGLKLRPHIKTHKLPGLARRQVELGATGITCQKLGEAEVMVDAGLDDILISYPLIGPAKALRLAALARRARMSVAVDSAMALETAAAAAAASGAGIGILVEFESGARRVGVETVAEALALAHRAAATPGLRFEGLMTYPLGPAAAAFIAEARDRFAAAGLAIPTVSGGGTPTAFSAHAVPGVTELRVGTYAYHDRATVAAGAATLEDCALHVIATVVSRPAPDRAVIDAGSKTLSSDLVAPEAGRGYGLLIDYPDAVVTRLNEEHGTVDLSACARKPVLGERLRILPNHVCVVSNLHDAVVMVREERVIDSVPVAARGRTT